MDFEKLFPEDKTCAALKRECERLFTTPHRKRATAYLMGWMDAAAEIWAMKELSEAERTAMICESREILLTMLVSVGKESVN